MTSSETKGIKTILHPVSDIDAAKAIYTALLGVAPAQDSPYYVGYDVAGEHVGLVPGGKAQGLSAPVAYWEVADIDARLADLTAAGATVQQAPHDVGSGRMIATVTDADGNLVGLLQDR